MVLIGLPGTPRPRAKGKGRKQRSTEEIKRFMEEGLCFHCEQKGHMAKDCPNASKSANLTEDGETPTKDVRMANAGSEGLNWMAGFP